MRLKLARYLPDRHDRRPAWRPGHGDQLGPFQFFQAPGGREPGEAEIRPTVQHQLESGRSLPTRQQPTDGPNLERLPGKPRGWEPPAPRDRPVQRPLIRLGLRPREIQDGNGQLATRLPFHGQEPGQLRRVEAPAGRIVGDPQPLGDIRQAPTAPTAFEPEPAPIESISHRDMEAGTGEPTGRRDPSERNRPLDERISRPMSWRPSPAWNIANKLSRQPEPI